MSYARRGCDGSDVYVYAVENSAHPKAQYECHECPLVPAWLPNWLVGDGSFRAESARGMVRHLRLHRLVGHCVPQSALAALRAET